MKLNNVSQATYLLIFSLVNVSFGFIYQIYALNYFGVGVYTDVLFFSMTIPVIIINITTSSFSNVLVPYFSGVSEDSIRRMASGIVKYIGLSSLLLTLLLMLSAPWWLSLMGYGFESSLIELALDLTLIQLLSIPLAIVVAVQWSALNGQKAHVRAEFVPAAVNVALFPLIIILIKYIGIYALAISLPLRLLLQIFIYNFFYVKVFLFLGFKHNLSQILRRLRPLIIGSIYYKSESIVDRSLLSSGTSGSLSLFYFSQQIYAAAVQILSRMFVTPTITKLSHCHSVGDYTGFMREYRNISLKMFAVIVFCYVVYYFFAQMVLEYLLTFSGRETSFDIEMLMSIMSVLFFMFAGNFLGGISSGVFYAVKNTNVPSYTSIISFTVYIPLKIILFQYYGVLGLAVSVSIFSVFNFLIISLIFFFKKQKYFTKSISL